MWQVGVSVVAPSKEGLANAELLEYMAKVLSVVKAQLQLSRGWSASSKFLLVGGLEPVDVFKRLKAAVDTEALPLGAVPGASAQDGVGPNVAAAATAGAASFVARRNWEENELLDDLAEAPDLTQQKFIK
jgi:hypothetical protein